MPVLEGREQERQGILVTANLMVVAARTAPKAGGKDDILTASTGDEGQPRGGGIGCGARRAE